MPLALKSFAAASARCQGAPNNPIYSVSKLLVGTFRPALTSSAASACCCQGLRNCCSLQKIETAGWHVSPSPERLRWSFSLLPRVAKLLQLQLQVPRVQSLLGSPSLFLLGMFRPALKSFAAASAGSQGAILFLCCFESAGPSLESLQLQPVCEQAPKRSFL